MAITSPDTTRNLPTTEIDRIGLEIAQLVANKQTDEAVRVMEDARQRGLSGVAIQRTARHLLVSGKVS